MSVKGRPKRRNNIVQSRLKVYLQVYKVKTTDNIGKKKKKKKKQKKKNASRVLDSEKEKKNKEKKKDILGTY